MIFTFEHDQCGVKVNHHAKYLSQMSFSSKVIVQTHRHIEPMAPSVPLKWPVKELATSQPQQKKTTFFRLLNVLQCFDAVGWAVGRASGL